MVAGGVRDVFVSNEVVAPSKIQRLVALAAQGEAPGMQPCAWDIPELLQCGRDGPTFVCGLYLSKQPPSLTCSWWAWREAAGS